MGCFDGDRDGGVGCQCSVAVLQCFIKVTSMVLDASAVDGGLEPPLATPPLFPGSKWLQHNIQLTTQMMILQLVMLFLLLLLLLLSDQHCCFPRSSET